MAKKNTSDGTSMNMITACISTTLMLVLLGMVVFFVCFAHKFSNSLKENFSITLMLDADATQKQSYDIQTQLKAKPYTKSLKYVSKEKACKELTDALGTDPTEFLGSNPMFASFELYIKAEYANSDSINQILPQLRSERLIVDVSAPQDLIDSLNQSIRHISIVLLVVALLLTLVSFVLINNTIHLSIHARRFMIRTMRLVGASRGFIRRPFVRKALLIGVVSSLLAIAAVATGIYYLIIYDPEMQSLVTPDVIAITAGSIAVCGLLLTWISAHFAVTRYLKMSNHRMFLS